MAATKFTAETRGVLIDLFSDGLTIVDAAKATGVREKTVRHWLTRGNQEETGPYAEFAARVREARLVAAERETPMDEDELRLVVSRSAKRGNVQAQKLYWEMIRADRDTDEDEAPADPLNSLDELAAKRAQRT